MQFKKKRNIVNKEIRLAKQAYYQNTFNDNKVDSKRTWETILILKWTNFEEIRENNSDCFESERIINNEWLFCYHRIKAC